MTFIPGVRVKEIFFEIFFLSPYDVFVLSKGLSKVPLEALIYCIS
jgi:hypothetical protein